MCNIPTKPLIDILTHVVCGQVCDKKVSVEEFTVKAGGVLRLSDPTYENAPSMLFLSGQQKAVSNLFYVRESLLRYKGEGV